VGVSGPGVTRAAAGLMTRQFSRLGAQ